MTISSCVHAEECKWRKNHVYYSISGEENVRGISTLTVRNCLSRVFHIFENAIPGYYFTNVDSAINEEIDVSIVFEKFLAIKEKPSSSRTNCTNDGDDVKTIRSGKIYFNTDFNYMCKHMDNSETSAYGVDLFSLGLHEVAHLIGMADNEDPTSIAFRAADNFDYYQKSGSLNEADIKRVANLYM